MEKQEKAELFNTGEMWINEMVRLNASIIDSHIRILESVSDGLKRIKFDIAGEKECKE